MSQRFIATFRAVFTTEDDVTAEIIAQDMTHTLEDTLDLVEDKDYVELTQVIPETMSAALTPIELVNTLNKTIDALIMTRVPDCFSAGRELDKIVFMLENRREDEPEMALAGYDYHRFIERAQKLLNIKA